MTSPPPRTGSAAGRDVAFREDAERREHAWLSPLACFSDSNDSRPVAEPADDFRPAFVRDRDRIVHCGAFRRLKDKTQVFVIDEGDFYRTRLTHTLEVAQMARFLCLALRLNESLGEALALVHDIGHPPFGHEGERILDDRCGVPFDHNRQALRIIDVLESPYPEREGLNLTHALRRSILKHGGDAGRGAPVSAGLLLEAQCVDLADSTAYQHHDLEDGLRAGILREEELAELDIWRQALEEAREARAAGGVTAGCADDGPGDARLGTDGAGTDGAPPRKAVLSRLVRTSLHDLVAQTAANLAASTAKSAEEIAAQPGRLVRFSPARASQHRQLAAFLLERFYRHPRVLRSAATAREAIAVIVAHYQKHSEQLPADYRRRIARDSLGRSVCDYVAGMTDRYAMDEWRRLQASRSVVPVHATTPADEERITALERVLGYAFHDRALAAMALTHASARSEAQFPNERLEFLGDSVLGVCVAQDLYHRFPDREEGELSRIKSAVVSRHALSRVAEHWGLDALLTLGPGIRTSGQTPASVVADAVEAVLGAVFVDGDLPPVRRIIAADFAGLIEAASDRHRSSNHKSDLQHFTQGTLGRAPHYQVLSESGPDHEKTFTVAAMLDGVELAVATGRNKRQAEQRAALTALRRLRAGAAAAPDGNDGVTVNGAGAIAAPPDAPPSDEPDDDDATG